MDGESVHALPTRICSGECSPECNCLTSLHMMLTDLELGGASTETFQQEVGGRTEEN